MATGVGPFHKSCYRFINYLELSSIGTGDATKTDEFSKKFQRLFRTFPKIHPFWWRHQSLRCVECQVYLSQKSCNGGPDGEIYCTVCYQVATHPGQRKLMVLSQDNFGTNCRRPKSRATSRATSRAPSRHRSQPRTSRSQPRSRSGSLAGLDSEEGNLIVAAAMANTANIKASVGASDGCPRCGGRVFEAEKVSFGMIFRFCPTFLFTRSVPTRW